MAKSTKHQEKVPALDDFRAPWETEAGTDTEIDKSKLKRFIHNLIIDKSKAQDAREDALADAEAATTERDAAKEQAANASPEEARKQVDKLTKERDDALAKVKAFEDAKAEADLRAEVLGDFATENPKEAKYVTGSTKEELEKSLESVKADFGITETKDDDDDDEEDGEKVPARLSPRTAITQGLAGAVKAVDVDYDKIADDILSGKGVIR